MHKSYPEELVEQYVQAIAELEEVKKALKKDPLDPRYTPRNTRYKYRSGYSTVQCAAVNRIGRLEKEQHILRTELRQRLTWIEDFAAKIAQQTYDPDILDYLGEDYIRHFLEELNENAKKEN
jgi:hypothetical protein